MEIHQLVYVVELAKQGNFTKAADEIYVSQSTLSHQIAKLEDELGIKLFERKSRSICPTQAGTEFISYAKLVLSTIENAKQSIQAHIGLLKGTLRIGVIASLGRISYAGMLANFYKQHPGLNFEIVQAGTYSLLEKLNASELDVAFIASPPEAEYEEIDFYHLAQDEYVLAVSPEHPFASCESIDLVEAANERFIFHPSSDRMYYTCMEACVKSGFKPNIVCQSNHSPTCLSLISAGMGIGFFPKEKLKSGKYEIAVVKLKQPIKKEIVFAIVKKESPLPAVVAFYEFVLKWAQTLEQREI